MDPSVTESEIAYPSEETLSRAESFGVLQTETSQLMDSLWLSVKTSGSDVTGYLIGGSILVALAVAVTVYTTLRRKRRLARRGISRRMNMQ